MVSGQSGFGAGLIGELRNEVGLCDTIGSLFGLACVITHQHLPSELIYTKIVF